MTGDSRRSPDVSRTSNFRGRRTGVLQHSLTGKDGAGSVAASAPSPLGAPQDTGDAESGPPRQPAGVGTRPRRTRVANAEDCRGGGEAAGPVADSTVGGLGERTNLLRMAGLEHVS